MSSAFLVVNSDFVIVSSTKFISNFLDSSTIIINSTKFFDLLVIPDFKENVTQVIDSNTELISLFSHVDAGAVFNYAITYLPFSINNVLYCGIEFSLLDINIKEDAPEIVSRKLTLFKRLARRFAHELNNILAAIMGSVSIMEIRINKSKEEDSDKLKKNLDVARDATFRAKSLVMRLSDFIKNR